VKTGTDNVILRNLDFVCVVLVTGLILLIPAVAMQFGEDVKWDAADFLVAGFLLLGAGSLFVLVSRRTPRSWRALTGILCAAALLAIWAELAVGILTDLGN
jgi:hypothetical protein